MASIKSGRSLFRLYNKFNYAQCTVFPKQDAFLKNWFHSSSYFNAEGIAIRMPSLSPTMTEGTIIKWLKKEGDTIEPGDIICDIQTDKAVVGYEMDDEGILAKIILSDDTSDVKVGTLIALRVEEGEDWKSVEMPEEEASADVSSTREESSTTQTGQQINEDNYGPSVRLLLEIYGLSSDSVPPSGPHNKLLKGDVLKFVKANNIQPQPPKTVEPPKVASLQTSAVSKKVDPVKIISGDGYDDVELTNMRKTIAKRLTQSKTTVAHSYCTLTCNINSLIKLRKRFIKDGTKISLNDAIIKAAAVALMQCPEINCVWEGSQLVQKDRADISVAVATPAGLITPIVEGADRLGLEEIGSKVKDLATRAKDNKLKLNEFQGGTFTISNLGMFGIREFSAIINQPQCAILAVGGGSLALDQYGLPETRMSATLSYDRLAIGDDDAAEFMRVLKDLLEEPETILLGRTQLNVNHPLAKLL